MVVGHLGRAVGLKGGLKLALEGDFIECLQSGVRAYAYHTALKPTSPISLSIARFEAQKKLIFFEEIQSLEQAKTLACSVLAMSQEDSLKYCPLREGEFLYFQLLGLQVVEKEEVLGVVVRIERLANTDYLFVQNTQKTFLIPYIDAYIVRVDLHSQRIHTHNAKGLLEES
ncbi:ribosome maturation factor RimM [Helicobacter baculiformis]|uniref:Ribosome maturation factor RimM n=1 Tax=Helicobacter baculiformis TaxID=427351 RepID=A0ABV7ZJ12_9HELI|nr:ribosome maturation factor RimM [Helicobacter baculiformis]